MRNHVVDCPEDCPEMVSPDFDCITELWFDSVEDAMAVRKISQSEEGRAIGDDEDKFMDNSKTIAIMVDEKVSDI